MNNEKSRRDKRWSRGDKNGTRKSWETQEKYNQTPPQMRNHLMRIQKDDERCRVWRKIVLFLIQQMTQIEEQKTYDSNARYTNWKYVTSRLKQTVAIIDYKLKFRDIPAEERCYDLFELKDKEIGRKVGKMRAWTVRESRFKYDEYMAKGLEDLPSRYEEKPKKKVLSTKE